MQISRTHLRYVLVLLVGLGPLWSDLAAAQNPEDSLRQKLAVTSSTKLQHPKLRGTLREIADAPASPTVLGRASRTGAVVEGDLIAVSIRVSSVSEVLNELTQLGRLPANSNDSTIEAYVSSHDLEVLEDSVAVLSIAPIEPPVPRAVSQGAAVHNATNWVGGGLTGAGVKVGVIDTGFDGFTALIGSEVPVPVAVRCYTSVGLWSSSLGACEIPGDSHGTAVVESLVDIAPGIQLYVARPLSRLDFQNTVAWMVSEGVSVINYSAATPWDGPGDGTSPYSDSLLRSVDIAVNGGATFVAAAGNEGASSWLGPWTDADFNDIHEFASQPGGVFNDVCVSAGTNVRVQLRWQDSWIAAARDLDLLIWDHNLLDFVASSINPQSGLLGHIPFEFVSFTAPYTGCFAIVVVRFAGVTPVWLQAQTFTSQPIQFTTVGGSIGNPAETANPGALAVGAAAWNTPTAIEGFSSRGPTPDGRVKPDIVGADRADTTSFGPGAFAGTSQASPHVAGLAALVKGAFPAYTPAEVAMYLKFFAQPRGAKPNNTWGHGFAHLDDLCEFTVGPTALNVGAVGGVFSINVMSSPACGWTVTSNAGWLGVQGPASGSGNGTVSIAAAPNGGAARVGTLTIAGITITVTQAAVVIGPPSAPLNLTSSVAGNAVSLSWQPPATGVVTAYSIEAGSAPGLSNIAAAPLGNVLSFAATVPNGTYYVRIRALSNLGTSPPSNELVLHVGPVAPGPPIGLAVNLVGTTAFLTWSPPSSGGPPSGYMIEASLTPSGPAFVGITVPTNGLTVPGVPIGTFYIRVRAINDAGASAPSNEVTLSFGVEPPLVPTLSGQVTGSAVSLAWSSAGAGALYAIHAGSGPGLSDIAVAPIGSVTAFGAAGVPPGTYSVRIVATTAGGSAVSNEITLVVN